MSAKTAPGGKAATNPLYSPIRQVQLAEGATGSLYADGAVYTWSNASGDAHDFVYRIDVATGKITASVERVGSGGTFAGDLLWLEQPAGAVALDPRTLSVVHDVRLPAAAATYATYSGSIAAAGGLVWVGGVGVLYGIDPATGSVVRQVPTPQASSRGPISASDYQITLGAPPDGSALWSAETFDGGGIVLQVRDGRSGAVTASSARTISGIGDTHIAASDGYAWVAYATGLLGSYVRLDNRPGLPAEESKSNLGGSNAMSVALAGSELWIYDPEGSVAACAAPATGRILQRSTGAVEGIENVTSLPGGQLAFLQMSGGVSTTLVVAAAGPACGT